MIECNKQASIQVDQSYAIIHIYKSHLTKCNKNMNKHSKIIPMQIETLISQEQMLNVPTIIVND